MTNTKNPPEHSQFALLMSRRFLPLFVTQFLGAFNDNFFKNALVILILFRIANTIGFDGPILVTIAGGIFILPFVLFSAIAGQLADKFEKSNLIQWTKVAEIFIMGLGALGFFLEDVYVLFFVLFAMGAQSAFFGPAKYSILPDHLREEELISGNALIETSTFVSIVIGTIAGGVLILTDHGIAFVSTGVLLIALLGWFASRFILYADPPVPELALNANILKETKRIVLRAFTRSDVRLSILGISWFWLVGAVFLSQFPSLAKDIVGANEYVVTLFLVAFALGIGCGSLLCNSLLHGKITGRLVPWGALGITIFAVDLFFASTGMSHGAGVTPIGVSLFLSSISGWRVVFDLTALAVCGGIFVVPLYAILQTHSDTAERSRTIAANNIVGSFFIVVGALGATMMLYVNMSVPSIFLTLGIVNIAVMIYTWTIVSQTGIKIKTRVSRLFS